MDDSNIAELEALLSETPISVEYIDTLNQLSLALLKQEHTNQRVLTLTQEAIDLCITYFPDYQTGLVNALITRGEYHRLQHNYAEVLRLHLQAEVTCLESGNLDDLIRLNTAQSALAYMMSDWTRYITINLGLLQVAQRADQPRSEAIAYNSLAEAYEELGDQKLAIHYREKARAIARSLSDEERCAYSMLGLSTPYLKLKQYDQALDYAKQAYAFYQGQHSNYEALNLGIIGHIYSEMGDYEQALQYFQRKFDLIDTLEFKYFRPNVHCELGMVYQQIGQHDLAIQWLESGIAEAEACKRTPILHSHYQHLVQAYKDHQDFEKALITLEKLHALEKEIHDTTVDNQRNAMLVMHETEQARLEAEVQRKRAEDLEKQAQEDHAYFEELNKLQKETLYTVTHDLKNPLTIIKMKTERLQRLIDSEFHRYLFAIEDQVLLMNSLITDLLEIAKLETKRAFDLQATSLLWIAERVIKQNRIQAEEKEIIIDFFAVQTADNYTYCFDAMYMERALNNLISNAIKYSNSNTTITVELLRTESDMVIRIADEGFGIAPEDLPHIFERFYRVQNDHNQHINGTGLGLAIVKSIIDQHKGRIQVDSTVGVGSTFSIHLPLKETSSQ